MTSLATAYTVSGEAPRSAVSNVPLPRSNRTPEWSSTTDVALPNREEATSSFRERSGETKLASPPGGRMVASVDDAVGSNRSQESQYSDAFRRLRARQALRQANESLEEFQRLLGQPESAFWMMQFRSALDDLWKVLPADKAPLAHAVAAVRASIRFNKWSAFKPEQVTILKRCLAIIGPLEAQAKDASHVYSVLHGGRLDPFPSAPEAAYEAYERDTQESE